MRRTRARSTTEKRSAPTHANDVERKIKALRETLPRLHWGRLRFLGKLRTLVLSYVVGIVVLLPDLIGTDSFTQFLEQPQIIWPVVTFVISIGLAYLSYEYFCPVIIKRFDNLSEFYEHQLNIKKLQLETYPNDPFKADMLHVAENYIASLGERRIARYFTLLFYAIGFIALLFLVVVLLFARWLGL